MAGIQRMSLTAWPKTPAFVEPDELRDSHGIYIGRIILGSLIANEIDLRKVELPPLD